MHYSDGSFFCREKLVLKSMVFSDVATDLNEREHLKMVIRSVPDYVSIIVDQTK